ncbi:hypothetical protein [Flavivirga eckloniae]|uniref:Uncharacterized protein n=1 Tax=Flavivirga eckloniae TaxID=1803846 RepID=A0A2K9PWI3_9FLAO|nr:hypothetical protein [Flavivirga eckloniae]AUP81198.1 hypothetical protein C1H87_21770 [Flavivirga eckloniae]
MKKKITIKTIKYFLCYVALITFNHSISQKRSDDFIISYPVVKSAKDLDNLTQGDTIIVEGKFKHFRPWFAGKGGGTQFFNFEIRLNNKGELPLYATSASDKKFLNEKVRVVGIYECEGMQKSKDPNIQDIRVRRIQKILSIKKLR